jgi:DNA sulfur modification protein DndD
MPYKGTQEVQFPVIGRSGIVVVYGDNMRGKTSFLNAIRWAFFGKAVARHGRLVAYKDLVNIEAIEAGEWSMWVEIAFEADGAHYVMRRSLQTARMVAHPSRNEDFQVDFRFEKDGARLDSLRAADEINRLLPEQISRFFLFDGELLQDYETLVRDPSPAQGIKAAIERVLGVPALIHGRTELGTLLGQAQAAQAQELRHVKSMRSQAEQQIRLAADIIALNEKLADQTKRKDETDRQIAGIDDRLEELAAQADLHEEYTRLKNNRVGLKENLVTQVQRRATLLQEAWRDLLEPQLRPSIDALRTEQHTLLESFSRNAKLNAKAELMNAAYRQFHCDVCDQEVPKSKRMRLATRLGEAEGVIQTASLDVERFSSVSARLERLARISGLKLTDAIVTAEAELDNLAVEVVATDDKINQLEQEIDPDGQDEILRLTSRRAQLQVAVGKLDYEIALLQAQIDELTRKQAQIARLLARNPDARRQRSSVLVDKYGALERIFAASVDKLRAKQRDRVAVFASAAFAKLTTEAQFQKLTINDNYGLSILDEAGRPVAERSAGAEQVVALSLIDGLNKVARRYDPVVMDTPFGRLDKRHREKVLQYLPEMAEQVILLVHEGEMDPERDLPLIEDHISARYVIERVGARQSRLREVPLR